MEKDETKLEDKDRKLKNEQGILKKRDTLKNKEKIQKQKEDEQHPIYEINIHTMVGNHRNDLFTHF